MLVSAYQGSGLPLPWQRQIDAATVLLRRSARPLAQAFYGIRHHPVWDACNQITWVLRALGGVAARQP